MVAGDVVNTAARLQSAAPDQRHPRRRRDVARNPQRDRLSQPEPVEAKGQGRAGAAWEVAEARGAHWRRHSTQPATPLVGRGRERTLLAGAVRAGSPGVVDAARHPRRRAGHRQEPRSSTSSSTASSTSRELIIWRQRPLAAVRRGGSLLGARRDGQGADRHPRDRRRRGRRPRSSHEAVAGRDDRRRPSPGSSSSCGHWSG